MDTTPAPENSSPLEELFDAVGPDDAPWLLPQFGDLVSEPNPSRTEPINARTSWL